MVFAVVVVELARLALSARTRRSLLLLFVVVVVVVVVVAELRRGA